MPELKSVLVTGGAGFIGANLVRLLLEHGYPVTVPENLSTGRKEYLDGLDVEARNLENPRQELEDHYYEVDHRHLLELGYQPTHDLEAEMLIMLRDLMKYRDRIQAKGAALIPDVRWDGRREKVRFLEAELVEDRVVAS